MQSFIIHLERATARRRQVDSLLAALPPHGRVLPAVDGLRLTDAEVAQVVRIGLHRPLYPFPPSRAEVACFLSHRRAWEAIVDEGIEVALVVEDDAAIDSPGFADVLAAASDHLQADEFIRLPHRECHEPGPLVRSRGDVRIMEPRLPALGMVMQLVGREAARRLLQASRLFDRPVDSFVQMQWLHGARILTARPSVIREIGRDLGGSLIHPQRPGIVHKLTHELQRPLIRLALHRANERWRQRAA